MSVKAYEIIRANVESDIEGYRKQLIYISKDVFFNTSSANKLIDLFLDYGYDGTNEDLIGSVELDCEQFQDFMKNESLEKWNEYDLEILKKIQRYFDKGHYLLELELM